MTLVRVRPDALSPTALRGLVEELVSREGTDYGHGEHTFDDKCAQVMRQLESGEAVVVFDTVLASANIALARDLPDE